MERVSEPKSGPRVTRSARGPYLRRGRPSSIRRLNRFRIFDLCARLVATSGIGAWTRAARRRLSSWEEPGAAATFDLVGLILGEIMVAGVASPPREAEQARLQFDDADADAVADAVALSGADVFPIFADLLQRNVIPLWNDRAVEALADPAHGYHDHVFQAFGNLVADTVKSGMAEVVQPPSASTPPPADDCFATKLSDAELEARLASVAHAH